MSRSLLPFARFAGQPEGLQALAGTVFFAGVVMAQIGSVFTVRTERRGAHRLGLFSNRFLLSAVILEVALAILLIYFKPAARLFGAVPLPAVAWVGLVLYGPIVYGFDRLRRGLIRQD